MSVVDDLFGWASAKGLIRRQQPIQLTLDKLQALHAEWRAKGLPPVMTFCGCPLVPMVPRGRTRW